MSVVGDRLKRLRTAEQLSQEKIAKLIGVNQPSVNRYERGITSPSLDVLLWYADFFDVSMDFIFGRTEDPHGKRYEYQPQSFVERFEDKGQLKKFVEYCFEPGTAANEKLKAVLVDMLGGSKNEKGKGNIT